MKIAVISDIHSNYAALQTAVADIDAWQPDAVVVAGDIVNRGPHPAKCLNLVQHRQQTTGWLVTRGNHEDYVIENSQPDPTKTSIEVEMYGSSRWTAEQLPGRILDLAALPFAIEVPMLNGQLQPVRVTHASMCAINDGIYPQTPAADLKTKLGAPIPAVLVVGHTHRPLVRQVDDTLVVNAGAVGAPFDGDRRLSYARLTHHKQGWQAEIVRLDYDYAANGAAFSNSGYMAAAGPIARLMFEEWQHARALYPYWSREFQKRVAAGEIGLAESVDRFLATFITPTATL